MPESKVKEAAPPVIARSETTKQSHKGRTMPESKLDEAVVERGKTVEGLPREAFAIVGDPQDPESWKLPHHTRAIFRNLQKGFPSWSINLEKTVDWDRMPAAVAALSRGGYRGERVRAPEEDIIRAARHLARHYEKAGKSVPDTLGALI
jgi:hypothetical protein